MKRALIGIVDAAHARIYTYSQAAGEQPSLVEDRDLVNAGRQAHGMFTDKPPRAPGDNHGTKDDHRTDHVEELDARFSREIIAEIDRISRERAFEHVILIANPKMLGTLRAEAGALRRPGMVVDEIAQDLAWLTSPQIHDHLAAMKLIEPRPRAAPRILRR